MRFIDIIFCIVATSQAFVTVIPSSIIARSSSSSSSKKMMLINTLYSSSYYYEQHDNGEVFAYDNDALLLKPYNKSPNNNNNVQFVY